MAAALALALMPAATAQNTTKLTADKSNEYGIVSRSLLLISKSKSKHNAPNVLPDLISSMPRNTSV